VIIVFLLNLLFNVLKWRNPQNPPPDQASTPDGLPQEESAAVH
jgi:hypothetical protein